MAFSQCDGRISGVAGYEPVPHEEDGIAGGRANSADPQGPALCRRVRSHSDACRRETRRGESASARGVRDAGLPPEIPCKKPHPVVLVQILCPATANRLEGLPGRSVVGDPGVTDSRSEQVTSPEYVVGAEVLARCLRHFGTQRRMVALVGSTLQDAQVHWFKAYFS